MQDPRSKHPISSTPFEYFYHGSWHGTDLVSIINGRTFVHVNHQGSTREEEISGEHIRLHSRKANASDCLQLKVGTDVCVLSTCRISECSDFEPLQPLPLWYDAKIVSKKPGLHEYGCSCLFSVILYKERASNGPTKHIWFERAEVVTIDKIAILQKLNYELSVDGFYRWNCSEDCVSYSRSKLLSGLISAQISWLIVLSVLKGMCFHIKSVERMIIYQILEREQMSADHSQASNINTMYFKGFSECSRPVIETLSPFVLKKVGTKLPFGYYSDEEKNNNIEVESESDIEVLYDRKGLRRSKRRKIQPDRFTSFSSNNFDSNSKRHKERVAEQKKMQPSGFISVSSTNLDNNSKSSESEVDPLECRKSKQSASFTVEEQCLDSSEFCQNPLRQNVEDISEEHPTNSQVRLNKHGLDEKVPRKRGRPRIRDKGKVYSHRVESHYPKVSAYRKKLLSALECKKLIQECMGNIMAEIDADFQLKTQPENIISDEKEDFIWSTVPEDQIEVEEHEDLWNEMEHILSKAALLEKKQDLSPGSFGGIFFGSNKECQHDYILDEQIGNICRFCNFVKTDIKDILPPFAMTDGRNSSKEYLYKEGFCKMGTFVFELSSFYNDFSDSNFASFHENDNIWSLIPALKLKLYDYQKKAFEFIWRNITGSLNPKEMDFQSKNTGGCIISHSPGSGKTFLLISFIISYLTLFPRGRPLVLAPKVVICVWRKEFEKWGVQFPLHIIQPVESYKHNSSNYEKGFSFIDKRKLNVRTGQIIDCLTKLKLWHEEPSILLMSYSSFLLMQKDSKFEHKKFMARVMQESPGLLILDEGHNPRSTNSKLRNLLMEVKTKSRVLLSGTLFQNNFEEYFNTLSLARPSFVDDALRELTSRQISDNKIKKKERFARKLFKQRVGEKILSSMEADRKQGFDVLNNITGGFIDIYEDDTSNKLPGLQIYTLVLMPTDIQHELLVKLQNRLKQLGKHLIGLEILISVGSIHPCLINSMPFANEYFTDIEMKNIEKHKENVMSGSKVKFVFDLVHKSTIKGEKVLIFSHNLSPINLLVKLFENIKGWTKGNEVLVLQGEQELSMRAKIMEKFNGDRVNKCKLLIASTSACAEGISLTAASRVILLDSEWNHSKTQQAIARAFRPGQERKVYVYKLLVSGTWEEDKYQRNECKAWLSKMINVGEYIKHNSCQKVDVVEDELLRELMEEDQGNMFKMITKQD